MPEISDLGAHALREGFESHLIFELLQLAAFLLLLMQLKSLLLPLLFSKSQPFEAFDHIRALRGSNRKASTLGTCHRGRHSIPESVACHIDSVKGVGDSKCGTFEYQHASLHRVLP